MEIYERILCAQQENRLYAVATVVQTQGSTARSPGAKMLVYGNGETFGSVGGGSVEQQTAADSLVAMKTGKPVLKTYATQGNPGDGMACSGSVMVFIEPGRQLPHLYLCGCGHVAQAVLPLAKSLGYYVVCVDARDVSAFRDRLREADELHILEDFGQLRDMEIVPDSYFVICSYSHKTDGDLLEVVLNQQPKYVGMLGGKPKIRTLFGRLREQGYPEETLREIHAPIGLDLGGETPAEIALSIMAQIQTVRYGRTGQTHVKQFPEGAL